MGKELEQTVRRLVEQQQLKKNVGAVQYQIGKEYDQLYSGATAMLRAGHVMPRKSEYFAEITEEQRGRVDNAYIVQKIEEKYPQLANVIESYRKECREETVEKLNFGTYEKGA